MMNHLAINAVQIQKPVKTRTKSKFVKILGCCEFTKAKKGGRVSMALLKPKLCNPFQGQQVNTTEVPPSEYDKMINLNYDCICVKYN